MGYKPYASKEFLIGAKSFTLFWLIFFWGALLWNRFLVLPHLTTPLWLMETWQLHIVYVLLLALYIQLKSLREVA